MEPRAKGSLTAVPATRCPKCHCSLRTGLYVRQCPKCRTFWAKFRDETGRGFYGSDEQVKR